VKSLLILGIALSLLLSNSSAGSQSEIPKTIIVDIERQKLFAYSGETEVYEFDCVTGRTGKETELGHFVIHKKVPDYFSNTYKTDMPYSLFFSEDGKAIHQTKDALLRSYVKYLGANSVGSHGCVGLSEENARTLYSWASVGTGVEIVRGVSGTWKVARAQEFRGKQIYFTDTLELKQNGSNVSGLQRTAASTTPKAYAVVKLKGTIDSDVLSMKGVSITQQTPIPIPNSFWCLASSELRFAFKNNTLVLRGRVQGCGSSATVVLEKVSDR
jgi:hypothetical protein